MPDPVALAQVFDTDDGVSGHGEATMSAELKASRQGVKGTDRRGFSGSDFGKSQ